MRLSRKTLRLSLFLSILMVCACNNETKENTLKENQPVVKQTEPSQETKKQSQIDVKEATRKELEAMGIKDPEKASPSELNYNDVAEAYCECSMKSQALNEKMEGLANSGDSKKFEEMTAQVSQEFKNAVSCAKSIKEKATKKALDKAVLVKEMKGICPDLPAKLVMDLITKV